MFDAMEQARLNEIHFFHDKETKLKAIIAIHDTQLGPALGGCRCLEYASESDAITDAIRLAQGMSYKAALAGIAQGGGKAVLLKPKHIENREAYYHAFGRFVDSLAGRYITAVDSGSHPADMECVATQTPYVSGISNNGGDPSLHTAISTFNSIKACVEHLDDSDSLANTHIGIQGIGNVGSELARLLADAGAKLTLADIDEKKVSALGKDLQANIVKPKDIHRLHCDVYAPCGLGGTINPSSVKELNCRIIAGSANNQLLHMQQGEQLHQRGILYAPDYVVNAGGLIHVSLSYSEHSSQEIDTKIANISATLHTIFNRSKQQNKPTSLIATQLAESKLYGRHP